MKETREGPNGEIVLDGWIPDPDAPWKDVEAYALGFLGYEFVGRTEALEALSKTAHREHREGSPFSGDFYTLRAVLFYEQRLFHDSWGEPDMGFVGAILRRLRELRDAGAGEAW